MTRVLTLLLLLMGFVPLDAAAAAGQEREEVTRHQDQLQNDLGSIERRFRSSQVTTADVVADAQRLSSEFRELAPFAASFRRADLDRQRQLAHRSFVWLDSASTRFRGDNIALPALMRTYYALGDFYRASYALSPGYGNAWLGSTGASRLARALVLEGTDSALYESELERIAIDLVTYAYLAQYPLFQSGPLSANTPASPPPNPRANQPAPITLPSIDESALDTEQKAAWTELREHFLRVAHRVDEARTALADLAGRLGQRGFELNVQDAATALTMQGYIEDAVEAIKGFMFDRATDALVKADYERRRLRNTTGQ